MRAMLPPVPSRKDPLERCRVAVLAAIAALLASCAGPRIAKPAKPREATFFVEELGHSVLGREIEGFVFPDIGPSVLIIGGIHGSEASGTQLARALHGHLVCHPEDRAGRPVVIIPCANPDGLEAGTRTNANGVDLNRNFPASNYVAGGFAGTEPLCEPESQAIAAAIERYRPSCIVAIHAPLACVDADGTAAAEDLARQMAAASGLPFRDLRENPGSLGSYAGRDLGILAITYELGRRSALVEQPGWADVRHIGALLIAIRGGEPIVFAPGRPGGAD